MSRFTTILEMALISYTMIGGSRAPGPLAAFLFWRRVTRAGGVASIAAGMLTVVVSSATLVAVGLLTRDPADRDGTAFRAP